MATLSQQQQVPPSSPGGMLKGLASTSSLASISSAAPAPAPASASATASATATASASSPLAAAESALVLGAWHRPAAPPSALGSASESAVFLLQSPAGTLLLPWKRAMLKHLVERNGAQCDSFASLIDHHIKQMDVLDEHQAKMTSATRELASLQQENRELKHQLAMSKDHSEMSSALAVRDKVSALEEKLQRTQEELTESYKLKGQNAQMLLDLSQQIKVKDEELRQRQTEHKELLARIATSEKACEDVTARFNESMVAIQILQDELQALQLELLKVEERNKILEVENTSLVERWLRKMNEEALKMNEANMFYESVVDMKKREALMDAAQDKLSLIRQADLDENAGRRKGAVAGIAIPTAVAFKISAHESDVNDLCFNSSGSHFVTASSDKTVKIWDAKSGKSTLTLSGAMQGIMCVSFNTKDDLIVAGSNDNATRVWSSQTGRLRHTLTGHLSKIFATRFVGDSSKVISGSHDRTIKIWDLAKGYCIKTIFSFSSCNDVILGDDSGTALVSGHVDNHIRFWDSRTGDCTSEITGIHTGQITSLAVSTDRRVVLSNSRDNTMKLIDVRMLQVVNTLFHDSYRPGVNWSKACFSPDGRYVAAANGDGSVLFWNLTTGKMEKTFKEHPNNCNAVAWHPAGHQVISCDKDKNVVVYE